MNKLKYTGILLLMASTLFAADKRPNVLLIISDDQGFCELGTYADFADPDTMGAAQIKKWRKITEITPNQAPIEVCMAAAAKCMPNIDGLAKKGLRFTDFHAAPTCGGGCGKVSASELVENTGLN